MDSKHLSLEECEPRRLYYLASRNLAVGIFNPETKGFIGLREKMGDTFLFTEYHWDNGAPFGTARPLNLVTNPAIQEYPRQYELREYYPTFCRVCGAPLVRRQVGNRYYLHSSLVIRGHEPEPTSRVYEPLFDYLMHAERKLGLRDSRG